MSDQEQTRSHIVIAIGTQIAQYRVDGYLGAGGMGEVYLAHDTRLNRNAALKFLPGHLLTEATHRQRFTQEAQAAARINHPNIVTIYDVGEFQERPFIAMEHLEGETLKGIIQRQGISGETALEVMRQIASGVAAAHEGGIVHRDLKPDNIMIGSDNRVKIMDFGLAYQLSAGNNLTQTGTIMGTPHYMSPEQVTGGAVDQRTDIFSLGVIFYELLSGVRPFDGDYHLAVLYAIVNHEPRPIEEVAPFVEPELAAITMRCLERSVDVRYRNAGELLNALREIGQRTTPKSGIAAPPLQLVVNEPDTGKRSDELIGRDTTLQSITRNFPKVIAKQGSCVIISGEAGVGKSSLAAALSRAARADGMSVLRGRCLFEEGQLPYHPFSSALKDAFIRVDDQFLTGLVAKGKLHSIDLTPLLPVIRTFLNISSDSVTLLNREQLWAAVLSLFAIIAAERPMLLIIDDLQWADRATLALFSYLARSCSLLPIMLVGMHRDEEKTAESADTGSLMQVIRQLRIDNVAEMIPLNRFTLEETRQLLSQILENGEIDPSLSEAVYERSLGNPLFSNELIKLLRANNRLELVDTVWKLTDTATALPVPQRVQDVIVNRLEGIDNELRELLDFASCEGESFPSDILVGCLKKNRIDVLRQLQALEKEHALIRHREHLYYFDHPLIREVLYDGILPELREEYHRLIAEWLIEKHKDAREYASRIARHLFAARQEQDALPYLLLAAEQAKELHALEDAGSFYQKALALLTNRSAAQNDTTKAMVYEGLGDVYFLLGRADEAKRCFEQLLSDPTVSDVPARKGVIQRKLAEAHRILGNTQEALALGRQALTATRENGEAIELVRALNVVGFLLWNRLSAWEEAMPMLSEALTLARTQNDIAGQIASLNNLGLARIHRGDFQTARAELEEARHLQSLVGDLRGLAQTENHLGIGYFPRGKFEEAIKSLQTSLDIRRRISDINGLPGSTNGLGDAYRELGDIKTAYPLHSQGLELARQRNNKAAQCDNLRDLGEDLMKLGKPDEAKRYLDEVLTLATEINHSWYQTRAYAALALWFLAAGKLEEADEASARDLQMAEEQGAKGLLIEALWVRARYLQAAGKADEAIALLRQSIIIAREGSFLSYLWQMLRDLADLYRMSGKESERTEAVQEARATIETILSTLTKKEFRECFLASSGISELLSSQFRRS